VLNLTRLRRFRFRPSLCDFQNGERLFRVSCGGCRGGHSAGPSSHEEGNRPERGHRLLLHIWPREGHGRRAQEGFGVHGCQCGPFQVPETLPPSALQAMGAPEKPADVMLLEREFLSELPKYDGFMFGMPTRFGMMASQMKAFFDGTGSLWQKGALAGKLGATFVSTGTQQGGQETTHFTAVTQLVHHGMCYVPLGYQAGGEGQFDLSEIHGGSPWGASTLAGPDGSRQPSALELKIAQKQGEVFGTAVNRTTAPVASIKAKVCIVYYSMYGHVKKLADEIAASMKEEGVSVDMFQAPELLGAQEDGSSCKAVGHGHGSCEGPAAGRL